MNPSAKPDPDRSSVKSAARVLDILELLLDAPDGLTLAAVGRRLGIPPSSAHALVRTLADRGYILREDMKLHMGHRLVRFAWRATDGIDLVNVADPVMRSMNELSGGTVGLGVTYGRNIVVIHQRVSRTYPSIILGIGVPIPANDTAIGKAILSRLRREELQRRYAVPTPEQAAETHTVDMESLERELQQVRSEGVAYNPEPHTHSWSVAGAILNRMGDPIAGVGIAVSMTGLTAERQARLAAVSRIAAAIISFRLGYADDDDAHPPQIPDLTAAWNSREAPM